MGPKKVQFPLVFFRDLNWQNSISKHLELQSLKIFVTKPEQFHAGQCYKKHDGSSPPEMLLGEGVLKICSKFTGEHPCRSVISMKLLCNVIEIVLRHGFSPVNLLHIFRTPF